jgi:hypothetical protein
MGLLLWRRPAARVGGLDVLAVGDCQRRAGGAAAGNGGENPQRLKYDRQAVESDFSEPANV